MKVLILGATGSVGRHLLSQALARGHEVTALVRDESKLGTTHERLHIIVGDALDPVTVDGAVLGQESVVFSLGRSAHRKPTTLFSDATRVLIRAMENHDVRRLVCITGIGAGDSKGHGGFLYGLHHLPFLHEGDVPGQGPAGGIDPAELVGLDYRSTCVVHERPAPRQPPSCHRPQRRYNSIHFSCRRGQFCAGPVGEQPLSSADPACRVLTNPLSSRCRRSLPAGEGERGYLPVRLMMRHAVAVLCVIPLVCRPRGRV